MRASREENKSSRCAAFTKENGVFNNAFRTSALDPLRSRLADPPGGFRLFAA